MQKISKIDNQLRLRLVKISAGLTLVGLLVLLRELGWHDVGLWPAIAGLTVVLTGMMIIGYLSAGRTTEYEQSKNKETPGQNDSGDTRNNAAQKNIDKTSLYYRIHCSESNDTQVDHAERTLRLLATIMPDKILALYSVNAGNMSFCTGARINSRQQSENIKAADELVRELTSRINSCIDGNALKQASRFARPLTFSRGQNRDDGMFLPVTCEDKIFAVLAVLSTSLQEFTDDEKELLSHFCASFGIFFKNQSRQNVFKDSNMAEAESRLTQRLFAEILPASAKSMRGWDIARLSGYSAEHSGDFHDYINLPGDRMLIIAGKSSAGGLNAALFLTRLRTMLSCMSESYTSPADLLNRLSTRLASEKSLDLFASMIVLQVKANDRSVTLAVAGHATPLVNRPRSGYVEIPQLAAGVPMGLFNQGVEPYQNQVIHLLPGDGILIYTDGAIDFAGEQGSRLGCEDLRLLLDKMPEQYADDLLANLADQLVPDNLRDRPLEDYTLIYASTE